MENNLHNYTQDVISKSKLLIPVLKTMNKLLNNTESATDETINERITYIRELFCNQKLSIVLKDVKDIDNQQLEMAENTLDKLKYTNYLDYNVNYFTVLKTIYNISDELHMAVNTLVSKSDDELNDISIEFCKHMIPIICAYNSRLK